VDFPRVSLLLLLEGSCHFLWPHGTVQLKKQPNPPPQKKTTTKNQLKYTSSFNSLNDVKHSRHKSLFLFYIYTVIAVADPRSIKYCIFLCRR